VEPLLEWKRQIRPTGTDTFGMKTL
jgi:hypothetical protein